MGAEGLGAIQIDVSLTYLFCSYLPLQYQYSKKKTGQQDTHLKSNESVCIYLKEKLSLLSTDVDIHTGI